MTHQVASRNGAERVVYLRDTLQLNHDPFAFPVAEWELQTNPDDPPFFAYYVDPPYEEENISLLDRLQQPGAGLIFGAAGSGKTTLCYRLEAACREMSNQTLVVSHVLGKSKDETRPESFWQSLAEALATDLFIQTVEEYYTFSTSLSAELRTSLAKYWIRTIPDFRRKIKRQLVQKLPAATTGMSSQWWTIWKRAAIRYTPFTPEREAFLAYLLEVPAAQPDRVPDANALLQGIALAHQTGFRQVFFLVDAADARHHELDALVRHIRALWEDLLPLNFEIPLYPKFFLPVALEPLLLELAESSPLISPIFSAIIKWNSSQALLKLINNRFHSAGSWITGFDVLASQDIASGLTKAIFRAADHSPRRLLQLLSLLIDAHVSRDPADPQITDVDWQRMCNMWSYGGPEPAPLTESPT